MAENTGNNIIEKLNRNNYGTWVEDIKVLLMEKNAYRIVSGQEPKPAAEAKEAKDFQLRSDRAYTIIYLNIEREYRILITGSNEDPKKAWDTLEKHFRPESRARAMGLTDEFFSCRINDGEPIGLYAARLRNIIIQLADADLKLDEWLKSFQLIRYLPAEYNSIVQTIYRWKDDDFVFDKVLDELLAEESRLKQAHGDQQLVALQSTKEIFNPSARKPNKFNKNNKNSKIKCFKCGKIGHKAAECRTKFQKSFNKEQSFVVEANFNENVNSKAWIVDTAASAHFCGNKELFSELNPVSNANMFVAVEGVSCPIEGVGKIKLQFKDEVVNLNNVMFSSKLRRNLMAGPLIDKAGGRFVGEKGRMKIFGKGGKPVFTANKKNGLYFCYPTYPDKLEGFATSQRSESAKPVATTKENLMDWHKKFSHINTKYIIKSKESVVGMPEFKDNFINCESCKLGKTRRKSFKPIGKIRSQKPLELLHMDLCGPLQTQSVEGHRYFLSIIDDFSRKATLYPLRDKTEVLNCFIRFQKRAERFTGQKIVNVRTDNGLEFCHTEFNILFEDQGIRAERTNTYSPEQNGVAERFNYTAVDAVRTNLRDSGLEDKFWSEALLYFAYSWNRLCHGNQVKTPFELFGGRKPSVRHLKVFGTPVYVGIPKQLRKKLNMRAKRGTMVGYAMKTRGYRIWIPEERKIIETINVTFEEKNRNESSQKPVTFMNPYYSEEDTESEEEEIEVGKIEDAKAEVISPTTSSTPETTKLKDVTWMRDPVMRRDKSRVDIYYKVKEDEKARLRSHNEVERYCQENNIKYNPEMFNFSGKDTSSGVVNIDSEGLNIDNI